MDFTSPAGNHLGLWVLVIPVIGGVIVGLMARYGSEGIRGHGIPEVIDKILQGQSRIAPRLTLLKPLSGAIAIGTGGPFGAEGPIIATGSALGSLVGQLMDTTTEDRKILLAAGGAAGMTAVFGSPISAVLLAIELLLFEFSARSLIPVMFASAAGMVMHIMFFGAAPIFIMPEIMPPTGKLPGLVWHCRFIGRCGIGAGYAQRISRGGHVRKTPNSVDVVARNRRNLYRAIRLYRSRHARRGLRQHPRSPQRIT